MGGTVKCSGAAKIKPPFEMGVDNLFGADFTKEEETDGTVRGKSSDRKSAGTRGSLYGSAAAFPAIKSIL